MIALKKKNKKKHSLAKKKKAQPQREVGMSQHKFTSYNPAADRYNLGLESILGFLVDYAC